jgi:carboxymethylenebutenolidase
MAGTDITITGPDGTFGAYLAVPDSHKGPGVVVIQEIFGVNKVIRDIADGLAAQGYFALAPDLFWRIEPNVQITDKSEAEWKKAFDFFQKFNVDLGVKDVQAAITHLRGVPGAGPKVGTIGFCLGGLLAFLSTTRTNTDAAVGYYGVSIERHLLLRRLDRAASAREGQHQEAADAAHCREGSVRPSRRAGASD